MLSLVLSLRAIAILLLLMIAFGYLSSGELQIKQFIAANILFALSLFGTNNQKRIAIISLLLAIIISVGAVRMYLEGEIAAAFAVAQVIMFVYLAIVAIQTMKRQLKK